MKQICIIDYKLGNIASIYNALKDLNQNVIVSNIKGEISKSSHIVLPGVGSFKQGMKGLKDLNLIEILNEEVIDKKKYFLGICLGMQLIASKSFEDGVTSGLDWIKGDVIKIIKTKNIKIPHMGWNEVNFSKSILYKGIKKFSSFYFVHSYYLKPKNNNIISGTCVHGDKITSSVEKDNIFATQFHPEKSHDVGLKLLKNFINN